jgi:sulfonate transport system ATP-binding protein
MQNRLIDLNIREKRFGERLALSEVGFTVSRGEVVSLVGPSGCGKSTLLRIVAGLDTVYEGAVTVLGHEPRLHARVQTLLAEVGLEGQAQAYPKQLSGGMAQRAAIARALFSRPDILLLDEPFSAVDPFTRMKLQDLLLSVAKSHGATLLVVTHDIGEAVYLSDRVIALSPGPGRIAGQVNVTRPRPRDRHDPQLALLQSDVLSLLEGQSQAA